MSIAEILVENIIVWYGKSVSRSVFNDYVKTYIEMEKPYWMPMMIHKLIGSHNKRREFCRMAKAQGILLTDDQR
jgi:hypothetical protein